MKFYKSIIAETRFYIEVCENKWIWVEANKEKEAIHILPGANYYVRPDEVSTEQEFALACSEKLFIDVKIYFNSNVLC